jgi:hypothetical protein
VAIYAFSHVHQIYNTEPPVGAAAARSIDREGALGAKRFLITSITDRKK